MTARPAFVVSGAKTTGDVPTVQANGSVAWEAASGGAQPVVLAADVPLASSDILALNSTPFTLVDGVADFAILPVQIVFVYHAGGTPYSGTPNLRVFVGPNWAGCGWGNTIWTNIGFTMSQPSRAALSPNGFANDDEPFNLLDGQPLKMDFTSAATAGDGTLTMHILYSLVPLT